MNRPQNQPQPDERAKAVEALTLRRDGLQYREIADRLGYADESGARKAVQRLLDRTEHDGVDQLRTVFGARLEALIAAYFRPAVNGDTDAAQIVLRTHDRLARLYGANMPDRVSVGVGTVEGMTEVQWANEVARMLGVLDAGPGGVVGQVRTLGGDIGRRVAAVANADDRSHAPEGASTPSTFHAASVATRGQTVTDDDGDPWSNIE